MTKKCVKKPKDFLEALEESLDNTNHVNHQELMETLSTVKVDAIQVDGMWQYYQSTKCVRMCVCACVCIHNVHIVCMVYSRGGSRDFAEQFPRACLSRMRTVGSSRRVSSDATSQIFAKVSNFPSWRPKKKKVFTAFP